MSLLAIAALTLVFFSALLLGALSFRKRRAPVFRRIAAYENLHRVIGLSVENGTRLHFTLGRGGLLDSRSAAALAALSMMRRVAEQTAPGDRPPVATSGDALLAMLSQDTLQAAHQAAGNGVQYDPNSGRLAGLTNFSYAAGALPVMCDESVSANLLIGSFGPEAALLADTAERENAFLLAATDSLPAQAVLYANAQEPLVGEELYAAGAYVNAGPAHRASLQVQDILRWLIVLALLAGSVYYLLRLP